VALGIVIVACLAVPLSQRGEVSEDRLSVSERLAAENPLDSRRLWIWDEDELRFMSSPKLLLHPFALAGLAAVVPLAFRFRASRVARFTVLTTVVTALLVLTPVTAPLTARLISAGLLWRIVWLMPFTLAVVAVFAEFGPVLLRRPRAGAGQPPLSYAAPAVVCLVAGAALLPRIFEQVGSVKEYKILTTPLVTGEEKAFFDAMPGVVEPGSVVMSPPGTEIPDQTYRMAAIVPGVTGLAYRTRVLDPGPAPGQGSYAALARFYNGPALNRGKLEAVRKYSVDYVIFLRASEALPLTERVPGLFTNVYGDATYLVFRVDADVLARTLASGRF
jgi:hypothetical protein